MNAIRMNEIALSEELASLLAQIKGLISHAHHSLASKEADIYILDTENLLLTAKNLIIQAEKHRAEWDKLIIRENKDSGVNYGEYKHPL